MLSWQEGLIMRQRIAIALASFIVSAALGAQAQQSEPPKLRPPFTPTPTETLEIWQIDLSPSGTGFALTKPVEEGDFYVFKVWPDRATIRLAKTRVKKMAPRTRDITNEVLYQINLLPTGQAYSRDVPNQRGGTYEWHAYRGGTLVSVKKSDVKEIVKVTGLDAFKIHLKMSGTAAVGDLPMQGGGTVTVLTEAPNPPSPSQEGGDMGTGQGGSYWIYQGVPGVTDAWAPPQAIVDKPGDPPRARPN
jgi:hypothetical protein